MSGVKTLPYTGGNSRSCGDIQSLKHLQEYLYGTQVFEFLSCSRSVRTKILELRV